MQKISKKILVFSDSHGKGANITKAINDHNGAVDAFIFLGDGLLEAQNAFRLYPHTAFICVRGNCDIGMPNECDEALINIADKNILIMHGHKYAVKTGLMRAVYRAREREADMLLFGHTHTPLDTVIDGVHVFNPGSVGRSYPPTYGVISICDGNIICGHGKISEKHY